MVVKTEYQTAISVNTGVTWATDEGQGPLTSPACAKLQKALQAYREQAYICRRLLLYFTSASTDVGGYPVLCRHSWICVVKQYLHDIVQKKLLMDLARFVVLGNGRVLQLRRVGLSAVAGHIQDQCKHTGTNFTGSKPTFANEKQHRISSLGKLFVLSRAKAA